MGQKLYGEAPPKRGALFKPAVYKRVEKIAILVYERVTKSAAKWKKWWLKRVPHFDRDDYPTESERLKTLEKRDDFRKFYCFGLSYRYNGKGRNFALGV